ncbi:DUF4123 domain-containing protein [Paracoccus onubensis]|uniref:DUF4123 domain-containing protein n=1 Tax=Paracoccus onubensis TaxID=1675788 RepID=A0A418SN62_9RHOB|nr:DUF4123 domain-containing protein [Paracoccus onubensis]RJE82394.1 DUF4123 domain-containing protein [Paracoccus onubensis]
MESNADDKVWDLTFSSSVSSVPAIEVDFDNVSNAVTDPSLIPLRQYDPDGLRTYLVLDPTMRTAVTGLFDFDTLDIPTQSLFDGRAAEENAEVAPYLVEATVASDDRVPRFNRDFLKRHWGQNTGIIVRSHAPFDAVRKHFRKFTKLRRESGGGWFFFRFWDPRIASIYLRTVQHSGERAEQWFGRGLIDSYIVEEMDGQQATIFRAGLPVKPSNTPLRSVILAEWELQPFRNSAYKRDMEKMAQALKADFKPELKAYTPEAIVSMIRPTLERFMGYGFRRKEHLHVIAAWGLFFGIDFIAKDPDGVLEQICRTQTSEADRFAALKKRMAQFGLPESTA